MATRGLYRTKCEGSGAEYVIVEYGATSIVEGIPRKTYEERSLKPRFNRLPTKEAFEGEKH